MFSKKYIDKFKYFFKRNNHLDILHSRIVLYFILFLSTVNLVSCALIGDYLFTTYFILIGIITYFFSKNMMIILTVSLISSNIIRYGCRNILNEGMEDKIKLNDVDKDNTSDENISDEDISKKITSYSENDDKLTKVKKSKITKDNVDSIQDKYKELLTLQDDILGKIGSLEESLVNAEGMVNKIVKSIE